MIKQDDVVDCPYCENVGWYIVQDSYTGEPEQEQCEFCYTNPNSLFNYNNENNPPIT